MKRYPHFLTKAAGGRWPSFVVAVHCNADVTDNFSIPTMLTESLRSWHCAGYRRTKLEYKIIHEACGQSKRVFWDSLYDLIAKVGNVWVFSFNANRDWSLLGLWDELQNGSLRLHIPSKSNSNSRKQHVRQVQQATVSTELRISASSASRLRDAATGYLITAGPPSSFRLCVSITVKWLTWTDLKNYGITDTTLDLKGRSPARIIGDAFLRLSKGLISCDLGSLRTTAGSQAMHGWRHSRGPEPIFCHADKTALDIEEKSYYGGRCEAFHIGKLKGTYWHLDVRSMYPWICANHRVPTMLESTGTGFPDYDHDDELHDTGCIAEVLIQTEEPAYPYRKSSEIVWPTGLFWTTLAGPELRDARVNGRIHAMKRWAMYRMESALKLYAERVYNFREICDTTGDKIMAQVAKRLLVALPGKLGQRQQIWIDAAQSDLACLYGEWFGTDRNGKVCRFRCIGGHVQQEIRQGFMPDAVPAIASWVTSAGRMMLLSFIRTAGWENTVYVDTDAIIVNDVGMQRLHEAIMVFPCQWGYLRLEKVIHRLEIHGIKHYVANGVRTCAGLPKGTIIDQNGRAYIERELTPREQMMKHFQPQSIRIRVPYTSNVEYLHGQVTSGGTVLPWRIREINATPF